MTKIPATKGLWACLVLVGTGLQGWSQGPTPTDLLKYTPRNKEISISIPTGQEVAACEVQKLANGYLLVDGKKQPVRKLFSTNGQSINVYSYYKDGAEVYREIDSNNNGKVDQYRWLGTAGTKWGVDADEDGVIDAWRAISAEEVGQEAFHALKAGNFNRMKALFIDSTEIAQLRLPTADGQAIQTRLSKAQADFTDTIKKHPEIAASEFVRLETATPSLYLTETGEITKWMGRTILCQRGTGQDIKTEFLPVAEMIQVGSAWRLTAVPGLEETITPPPGGGGGVEGTMSPEVREKMKVLASLDDESRALQPRQDPTKYSTYIAKRIAIINEILPLEKSGERREMWYKQLCDNLSSAHLAGDADALNKLGKLHEVFTSTMPTTALPAYAKYRYIVTKYTPLLEKDGQKYQEPYQQELSEFVKLYPKSEDTPYALYQLALSSEFTGKDEDAKRWYRQLYTDFASHLHAEDAKGSERRLALMGTTLTLAGPEMGTSQNFDVKNLKGKIVIVYYWASYASSCIGDFARINKLVSANPNDVALVTVSLDDTPAEAAKFIQENKVVGTHLYQAAPQGSNGMKSPLAVHYGINGIPQMFVLDRECKVINNRAQVGDLEAEIKKAKDAVQSRHNAEAQLYQKLGLSAFFPLCGFAG